MQSFFTFQGTLGRLDYFIKLIVLFIATFIISIGSGFLFGFLASMGMPIPPPIFGIIIGVLFMVAYAISYFSITARRLHDLGFSGWWQLIPVLLPLIVLIYVWLTLSPMMGELGINLKNPATIQNFNLSRITTEQKMTAIGALQKASILNTVFGIFSLIFYLCLLFWPSRRLNNKYAFHDDDHFTHDPRVTANRTLEYFVRLKEPIHEDSMYVIPHIKKELPGVKQIKMPNDRSNMTFIVSNVNLSPKDIKRVLHKNGFFTTSIKQIKL